MALLVRTWNLFHGNSKPPQRRAFLGEMVRMACADALDVLCLQEVPAWALEHLDEWSGMTAIGDVAARPSLGPLPSTAEIGRLVTSLNHGLFRSAFSGQANAILLSHELRVVERRGLVLNPWRFRRTQARWLSLGPFARLAWAAERRICQAVRVALPAGTTMLVANLHATSYPPDDRMADAELLRAAAFADGLAGPDEPVLLCGDFNVTRARSRTLDDLTGPEWGFSEPSSAVDHVLVRGAPSTPPERWPPERRTVGGRLLSDHAPVEVRVG